MAAGRTACESVVDASAVGRGALDGPALVISFDDSRGLVHFAFRRDRTHQMVAAGNRFDGGSSGSGDVGGGDGHLSSNRRTDGATATVGDMLIAICISRFQLERRVSTTTRLTDSARSSVVSPV